MLSKYKHIIWDWNGTLLDDVWLCLGIVNKMLSKRDLPTINSNEYRNIFDFPVQNNAPMGHHIVARGFNPGNLGEYIK